MTEIVMVEFSPGTAQLGGISSLGMGGGDDNEDDGFELFGGRAGALEWTGMWVDVEKASI
jgi:hypothetical protein